MTFSDGFLKFDDLGFPNAAASVRGRLRFVLWMVQRIFPESLELLVQLGMKWLTKTQKIT